MKAIIPTAFNSLPPSQKASIGKFVAEEVERQVKERSAEIFDITLDFVIMLGVKELIDEFDFGTISQKGKESRLDRYITGVQRLAHEYSEKYPNAEREAIRLHLKNAGIEIEIK